MNTTIENNATIENDITEDIIKITNKEREKENDKETPFWYNFMKSLQKREKYPIVYRFQRLAGITNKKTVGFLYLPENNKIEFKEIPKWYNIIRYKICGFKCKLL
jgi:hypothetical protein